MKVTDKRLKEHFLKSGPSCMSFEERCSLKRGVPAQERFYFYFNIYDGTMGVCDTLLEDLHSRDIILTVVPSVQKKKIPYELRQLSGHFF